MNEITEAIRELEHLKKRWETEAKLPESAMTKSDVKFLDRQIRKLEALKEKSDRTLAEVGEAIKKHKQAW